MTYFIDSNIYYQGEKCALRRVPLYNLVQEADIIHGSDIDGATYTLTANEVFSDSLNIDERFYLEQYQDTVWIQEGSKVVSLFLRSDDGDFHFLDSVPYSEKGNIDVIVQSLLKQ